jgi:hypothetical protein
MEAEVLEGSVKGNNKEVSESTFDRDFEGALFDGVIKGPAEEIFSRRRSELRGKCGS